MENEKPDEKEQGGKLPDQKELEKELSDYLSKKYGNRIKVVSPFLMPKADLVDIDDGGTGKSEGSDPNFDMLPEELEAFLDSFVIKQDRAKAVLSTKICTHFNRVKYQQGKSGKNKTSGVGMIKNNIIMIGPTGVGKTYLVKLIAQKLGVPFVKGDATKFSETGYVGGDVEDLIRDLVYEANEDIDLAENGIIYIDEIDKIASSSNIIGHDVSRTGVQRALLKPMEETDIDLKVPHDPVSQIQAIEHFRKTGKKEKKVVNTKNILFIMSGAFGELGEIIKRRLQKQGIGFEADVMSAEIPWEILREVKAQDLIEFGFESEFVGRLPVVVVLDELRKEDLVEIMKNPNNPIILSKRQDFRAYGIDIKFEDEALEKISEMAVKERTGARGLVSAIERVLIPFEKHLPSTDIDRLLVTAEVVENPEEELRLLCKAPDAKKRINRFEKQKKKELQDIKTFISDKIADFRNISQINLYEERFALIAEIYLKEISDINSAVEDMLDMYHEVKSEEESLNDKLEVNVSFDDGAIDEVIRQSIRTGESPSTQAFQVAKKLEYGLKLVKNKSDVDNFVITADAILDMEAYINELVRKYYKDELENGREATPELEYNEDESD